jgi:homocysteine S-methyltransferase
VFGAHLDFFLAGARVATTCSYQVSYEAFARVSMSPSEVDELLLSSVALARSARAAAGLSSEEAWVFASIGPYGASRGDGSEYTGTYGDEFNEPTLRAWHRRRSQVLMNSAADAIICETIPSLVEARALLAELRGTQLPVVLSFTVENGALRSGESIAEAGRIAAATSEVIAVGVNCSTADDATRALRELSSVINLPLIVYPNSGEQWDARMRTWRGEAYPLHDYVKEWVASGARLVGGCCRIGTDELGRIVNAIR